MIEDDFKSKDIEYEQMQINLMYNSIVSAYEDYQNRLQNMTPQEKLRSTMIVVVWPGTFQDYTDRFLRTEAENSHGDIVLVDCGREIKRVRGRLKMYKEKAVPYQTKKHDNEQH